jgi:hypothetical protein
MTSINHDHLMGSNIKRTLLVIVLSAGLQKSMLFGQKTVYDNFEGNKSVHYTERTGVLDTMAKNPNTTGINKSSKCALYVRNAAKKFDNIKMELPGTLTGVADYATYLGVPPKLKIKLFTNAPAGTLVEILLGRRSGNNDYPAGTNSQFQVYTTVSNQWEELEFKFSQVPQGSETSFSQIDQVTLLFNPNSSTSNTYYFDEITGPAIGSAKEETEIAPSKEEIKKQEGSKTIANDKKEK